MNNNSYGRLNCGIHHFKEMNPSFLFSLSHAMINGLSMTAERGQKHWFDKNRFPSNERIPQSYKGCVWINNTKTMES